MVLLDDFSQLQLHGGMAACSYTSWWFLTTSTSMEAIFQSSRNFQSYTLPYNHHANFESCTLPIILLTFNPPLLVTKTSQNFQSSRNLTKTSCENFSNLPILHFWLRNLTKTSSKTSNPPLLVTQSYENFWRKLLKTSQNFLWKLLMKILKTSNPLAILRKLFTKISQNFQSYTLPILSQPYENFQFLHFWLWELETSNPINFRFLQLENLKNLQYYTLPTTSNPSLLGLFVKEIFPPKMCVLNKTWWFSPNLPPFFFFFWQNGLFFKSLNPKKSQKCL